MDLRVITPVPIDQGHGCWTAGMLRALLLRTQFHRPEARALGWRGIRPTVAHGEGWTCKLHGSPGVFGMLFEGERMSGGTLAGAFSLHYFPHPDEPRAERFSLAAGVATLLPDYWDNVREFPSAHAMRTLFRVGTLRVAAGRLGGMLRLELSGLSRTRVIAADGIRQSEGMPPDSTPAPEGTARGTGTADPYVVHPGDAESDIPSFGMALRLFRCLAASASFVLGEAPVACRYAVRPGWQGRFTRAGEYRNVPAPGVRRISVALAYGTPPEGRAAPWRPADTGPLHAQPWMTAHRPGWMGGAKAAGTVSCGGGPRPPLLVLTGFLGSGKTTLLRHFVEYNLQRDRFVAVIQNEIGAVGLDGKLLEDGCRVVEADEGCVCCSLSGRLRHGLAQVLDRFTPDVVVLETSGLANPLNLLDELHEVSDLVDRGAVITVVDTVSFANALRESRVARDQVAAADILVLNKIDIAGPEHIEAAHAMAARINPGAMLHEATEGAIPFGLLTEAGAPRPERRPRGLPRFRDPAFPGGPATHADDGYAAETVRVHAPMALSQLESLLEWESRRYFRIKGVVDVAGHDAPMLAQSVDGRMSITPLPGHADAERFLTFIGKGGRDFGNGDAPGGDRGDRGDNDDKGGTGTRAGANAER
ncbi:CobW family GTP-binding protein [Nitratidesulfovibrio sp. 1201_IL3209]|uniref:CobW family GTP-binding protein n=1 Tax=Nitratidesulfovibrio sp. 1201_IL3209 TaxID=3084053 RepID=UPI002FD88BD9